MKRFRYLWTWELFNALITLPALLFTVGLNTRIGLSSLSAAGAVGILLVIGAAFAFFKYQDLKNGTQKINAYEPTFRRLRWIIPLLLLVVALLMYTQFRVAERGEYLLSIALYVLAVLEYINYFHFQLMYDNYHDLQYLARHRRLKRGLIPREFDW